MKFCTFKNFLLKESDYKIDSDDRIFQREISGKKIVAVNHVNVTKIYLEEFEANYAVLIVDYESPGGAIRGGLKVRRKLAAGHRITAKWEKLFAAVQFDIKRGYLIEFCNLYRKYFCHCINQYIEENPAVVLECGWLSSAGEKIFYPITKTLPDKRKISMPLFNGALASRSPFHSYLEGISVQRHQELLRLLLSYPCMMTIFSYSVHAVLWNYLHGYLYRFKKEYHETALNADALTFSLCIYDDNPSRMKIVANLFSNFFLIKKGCWNVIDTHYHVSASTLSDERFNKLRKYFCVPVIFSTKKHNFTKASSILKKVQRLRNQGVLHIYPVYINSIPIQADEILNCSTASTSGLPLDDSDWLNEIHFNFYALIFQFVKYLAEISSTGDPSNETTVKEMHNLLFNLLKLENLSIEWIDSHTPELILHSAMLAFCMYLKTTSLADFAELLSEASADLFLSEEEAPSEPDNMPDTFLYDFREFIQESIKKQANSDWIWEGEESRGKEKCYYFYPNDGYAYYKRFMERKHRPVLSKRELAQKLRDSGLLKLPASGSSNTMKRSERHIYVYVIKRIPLENIQTPCNP